MFPLANRRPSRRTFLVGLGLGGATALGWGLSRGWGGGQAADLAAKPLAGALQTVEQRTHALGTEMSILALHARPEQGQRAIEQAFAAVEQIEQVMSIYRADSQLRQLNAAGVLNDPHPDLVALLRYAATVWQKSAGAFDVTVQPLWQAYDEAHRRGILPEEGQIQAARRLVDGRKVSVSDKQIRLGEGMAITLNGVAQGFAADRLLAVLRKGGIEHALVNAGEIAVTGHKASGQPWMVGIQHPRQPDAYLALASLEGRCLSTSGDYATTFSDDYQYHHIFDPANGRSPVVFSSVTVVAPTATEADALSTAIYVLGVEKGLQLARATPRTDVLVVMKDGRTLATEGFPQASA